MRAGFVTMLILCTTVAVPAGAASPWSAEGTSSALAGDYEVQGANPGGDGRYEGIAIISASGDTYIVEWFIGDQAIVGTGILAGDRLAVGYDGGTALYRIGKDGVLQGVWAVSGGDILGTETMIPISY